MPFTIFSASFTKRWGKLGLLNDHDSLNDSSQRRLSNWARLHDRVHHLKATKSKIVHGSVNENVLQHK